MPSTTAQLFLDASLRKIRETIGSVESCLGKLDEEQIWRRQAGHENTIGNLILHLCGNARQWIMHGVGNQSDVRTRDEEFAASGGLTKVELLQRFRSTLEEASTVIAALSPERLTDRTDPQKRGEVSVLDAIFQVVCHLQLHTGQIILLTKQMYGRDLDLTIPRKR